MKAEAANESDDVAVIVGTGGEVERGLVTLAAAESLTDNLARYLLEHVNVSLANELVDAIHICDFVVERNSDEWSLDPKARKYLQTKLMQSGELVQAAHAALLGVASSPDIQDKLKEVPRYLVDGVGEAYHLAFLDANAALPRYSLAGLTELSGLQWLASKLAREQQDLHVLPEDALELNFLQGMVYYREGRVEEAIKLLRSVANLSSVRLEVAIAAHLVGRYDGRRRRTPRSEGLLLKSLEINEALANRSGEAQVLNTLGQYIGRDRRRAGEAEQLLRRSIEVSVAAGGYQQASVAMHTLGQLIGRSRKRAEEAEKLLRQSVEISAAAGDSQSVMQTVHTLGQLIGRDRRRAGEAEQLLRESLSMSEALHDRFGEAQVLHTLGQLLGRDPNRVAEAEQLLHQSLSLGEALHNKLHQAQVLYTLGRVRSSSDLDEALAFLERSLALNVELRYGPGTHVVRRELRRLREGKSRRKSQVREGRSGRTSEAGSNVARGTHAGPGSGV